MRQRCRYCQQNRRCALHLLTITMNSNKEEMDCPICYRKYPPDKIEVHVQKCIFLNTNDNPAAPTKTKTTTTTPGRSSTKRKLTSPDEPVASSSSSLSSPKKPKTITTSEFQTPLAKQVQPTCLNDFVGQQHVFGENSVLRTLFEKKDFPNMILWGPPGCGKTSLAGVIQGICKENPAHFKYTSLCAATAGVKDVQSIITIAKGDLKFGRRTVLFMDEIHRFNKRQQDTFLLNVERGDIILIGATTENPSFSINNALLSRCRVIVFEKLDSEALVAILVRAVQRLNIELLEEQDCCKQVVVKLSIDKTALHWLADVSDGDARIALTNLQLVLQHNPPDNLHINVTDIKDGIKKSHLLYDKKGEEHYNIISAMHKSIRGSDVNASLYWLTRMIVSGEDPMFIARRLVRAASEDIGNADTRALQLAVGTMQGCQLLGMPECDVLLAQCAIYLARAPKSRQADAALANAKRFISNCEGVQPSVPLHLRNAPTKLMKELGYGQGSRMMNSFMPNGLDNVDFFD